MSSDVFFARKVRLFALAIPCVLLLLSGCDLESYPTDLTYPLRSDPIVTTPPGSTIWDTFGPGQLDHHIAQLSEVGGKTLDPAKLKAKERQRSPGRSAQHLRHARRAEGVSQGRGAGY